MFQPSLEAGTSRFEQLELDRPARLLLHDRRSRPHPAAADQFADPDLHDVTTTQFVVDRKVEERPVAITPFSIEPEPDGPNPLRLERALRANHTSGVPRPPLRVAGSNAECPILSSSWPDWP
jgi:hypothetical protein